MLEINVIYFEAKSTLKEKGIKVVKIKAVEIEITVAPKCGFNVGYNEPVVAQKVRDSLVGLRLKTTSAEVRCDKQIHFGEVNHKNDNCYNVCFKDLLKALERKDMESSRKLRYQVARHIRFVLIEKSLCVEIA